MNYHWLWTDKINKEISDENENDYSYNLEVTMNWYVHK
jgi:hypothetical protein